MKLCTVERPHAGLPLYHILCPVNCPQLTPRPDAFPWHHCLANSAQETRESRGTSLDLISQAPGTVSILSSQVLTAAFSLSIEISAMSTTNEEETPLLGPSSDDHKLLEQKHRRRVVAISFSIVLLTDFGACFLDAPQTSILESNICSRYYQQHDAAPDCTAAPVQAELATINQLLNTFNRLPGLFAAIPYVATSSRWLTRSLTANFSIMHQPGPYSMWLTRSSFGILADRYGRRPLFVLVLIGALLQDAISKIVLWRPDIFPPHLIWLSSLATFVGGGDAVASSLIFLIIADVALPDQRAKLFFILTACERVGEIIATPLSALLMSIWNPWIPYLLYSLFTLIAGMIPILFLPETLQRSKTSPQTTPNGTTSACESDSGTDESLPTSANRPSSISAAISKFRPLLKRNVIAVLLAFLVSSLGRQSMRFLLQYIRQRFGWTYEKVCTRPHSCLNISMSWNHCFTNHSIVLLSRLVCSSHSEPSSTLCCSLSAFQRCTRSPSNSAQPHRAKIFSSVASLSPCLPSAH